MLPIDRYSDSKQADAKLCAILATACYFRALTQPLGIQALQRADRNYSASSRETPTLIECGRNVARIERLG